MAPAGTNQHVDYYIYWPAHFDRHKKYRLFIGDTRFLAPLYQSSIHGPNWAEAVSACGAYAVVVNRKSWFGGIENCGSDIMTVYNHLVPDPTIDTDNIFLFATSAETTYISKLVEQKPELWKGLLLLNPTDLPDLSTLNSGKRLPKIFLSAGAEEHESMRFKQYQQEASRHGIWVGFQEIPDTGHFLISTSSMRDRTRAVVDFVFNN